ncbi:MAG: TolB protein [Actinomycetia bacterium]|nr:TolB protein [Actinomycetes bacterium]
MRFRTFAAGLLVALMTAGGLAVVPPSASASAPAQPAGRIAFSYGDQFPGGDDVGGHSDIYTVLPDGTALQQLTHVPADATAALPQWSPDGNAIVYQSNVSGNSEIWVMDRNGGHQRQVTHDPGYEHFEPNWSPDGRRIVLERCDQPVGFLASCDLVTVNLNGTERRVLVSDHRYNVHGVFSPDGKRVAFASDRSGFQSAIWVVNLDGSGLHQVTAPSTLGFWPGWSPDGRVIFSDHCCLPHSNVWSVRPDGTGFRRLTDSLPGHDNAFGSVSPDGRDLLYDSTDAYDDGCCNDLVVQHADGTKTTVLARVPTLVVADWGAAPGARPAAMTSTNDGARTTAALTGEASVASSVDNVAAASTRSASSGRIAFAEGSDGQVHTVKPDGSDPRQLTYTDVNEAVSGFPDISPDGRTVLYSLIPQAPPFEARTWSVNADGTGAHQVGNDDPGFRDYQPHYTPDGRQIVFARCQPGDGVCAIWVMRADGTDARAVTKYHEGQDEAVDFGLSVSSDGRHVAFARFNWRGIAVQVFVVNLDGSGEHAVTPAWLEAAAPSYSPDGRFLTVTSQWPRLGENIWTLRADGSKLRRLTATPYPNNSEESAWSPSGREIAFESDRAYPDVCCTDLFTMQSDGSRETSVSTGDLHNVHAVAWGNAAPGDVGSAATASTFAAKRSVAAATRSDCIVGVPVTGAGCARMRSTVRARFRK